MESSFENASFEIGGGFEESLTGQRAKGRRRRLTDGFGIMGPVLQQPRQFMKEIRDGVRLGEKIWMLALSSAVFLAAYGATLGSGHPLLSLNVMIAVPFLFLCSLVTCIPVMYLFDVLTGSQRSLAQMVAILLTALGAASTVFFSFAPIMVVFSLTGTVLQFFWLNVCILAMATLIGLIYMVAGIIQTAIVDANHPLSKVNRQLHFLWMLLFLVVAVQMAWGLMSFHQRTGGFLMLLIQQLSG